MASDRKSQGHPSTPLTGHGGRPVTLTRHLAARWARRFPGGDLAAAVARAAPVSTRRLMATFRTARERAATLERGAMFLYDPVSGALFVGRPCRRVRGAVVLITVYPRAEGGD